jgi:thiamine biosynthesis protein ThiS
MASVGTHDCVTVTVNGAVSALPRGTTIDRLLADLGVIADRVAVEVNLSVVERGAFATTTIEEGDRVEIVNFVGGGHG